MNQAARDMAALARVTQAAFDAEQARMAALKRAEQDVRALIAELDLPRHDPATPLADDAALRAGADLNWQLWVDSRRSALNAELARTLVAQAKARASLKQRFGRNEAAHALAERVRALADARKLKRSERDG